MNLKVFSWPRIPQIPVINTHYARLSLLSLMFLVSAITLAEARQIDWDTLNLTPQQETQMDNLENSWQKTHQEVSNQIERDMNEMKALLPTGDSQRIRQLQNRISTNKMYLMNESTDTFLRKRDMLTPAQRSQLQRMMPSASR